MKKYSPIFLIFIFVCFFYLPIFREPSLLTNRGNDLTEFFWPIMYFVRQNLLTNHQLPFWNNLFFSGTPLLPDPQAPIFYLPNIIFLFFKNIDLGFVLSIFLHIFAAGIGMFYLSRRSFKFSNSVSLFCSFIYIASPKLSGFIEAGHYGLITAWAWLPFVFLVTYSLTKKPDFKKSICLGITLSGLFYSHILIFAITAIIICLLFIYLIFQNKKNLFKSSKCFILGGLICLGLIAVALLPQISWQSETTRNLLLHNPDVYPKWNSKVEFIEASISPILFGNKFIWDLDTEKTIAVGLFVTLLSVFGFLKLKLVNKIIISLVLLILLVLSLNNSSPIYNLLIKQNWYILLRVSTRFWFIVTFIFIFLAGKGSETLMKEKKLKFLTYTLILLSVLELVLTSWTKILKPVKTNINLAPQAVYDFLSSDKDKFRVFCLNRCLSQKQSALYGLELADGYGTLQQKNYYIYSEQLSQAFYRNRYTLAIPPFEIYEYEKLQPYSPSLAAYNVKYVISNHLLYDNNLRFLKQIGKYLIYENIINLPRSNYPINIYTPNFIQVDTSKYINDKIILSEVFNKDWQAITNNNKEIKIEETPDKTRETTINSKTKFVNFIYEPKDFKIGGFITLVTTSIIVLYLVKNHEKN